MIKRRITKLLHALSLEDHLEDPEKIHESIETGVMFRGPNLWILGFAIVLASIGLNINSTAVVIGAMLISPLMSPIIGIGYSIATYDRKLFGAAVKNYTFAVMTGLITSFLYFALSPISRAHSELLARTSPTIYDVVVALFGGLAGIVAITSRQKGNVIPGVAIATALMPPLCTAGYGLATGQVAYFLGALYLFTINTVFIALSAMAISQVLHFPLRGIVNETQRNIVNRWITVVIIVTIVPSIYFGYRLVQQERFSDNAARYIRSVSIAHGDFLLRSEVDPPNNRITLVYGGNSLSEIHKQDIRTRSQDFSLQDVQVVVEQGFSMDALTGTITEQDKLKGELNRLLAENVQLRDSLGVPAVKGKQILEEIRVLFPQIETCSYASVDKFSTREENPRRGTVVLFGVRGNGLSSSERRRIEQWIKQRLRTPDIHVVYERT